MAVKTVESYVPRQILALNGDDAIRLPATIPVNAGDIDAGQVMGVRTADSMLLPVRRCLLAADAANAATTLTVGAANVGKFKVGDPVSLRNLAGTVVQNLGTVSAVAATTITVTTALAAAYTTNQAYLYVADGTEVAKAIMEYVVLNDAVNPVGVSPYVSGMMYEAELTGLDPVAIADLGARRSLGGVLIVPC
jgi:hypothetical protein